MDFSSQFNSLKRKASALTDPTNSHQHQVDSSRRSSHNHRSRREEEEQLHHLIQTIQTVGPARIQEGERLVAHASKQSNLHRRHIALLFLTIDDLPLEHIWKHWLHSSSDSALYISVLCHAKHPNRVQSPWLQQRLLVTPKTKTKTKTKSTRQDMMHRDANSHSPPVRYHSYRPEWGSVEITRAMLDLIQEALRIGGMQQDDPDDPRYSPNRFLLVSPSFSSTSSTSSFPSPLQPETSIPMVDQFIFLSESCLPIASSPLHVSTTLMDGYSWIHARNTPNNGYSRQLQWDAMSPSIPQECIWKADQWMVLNRSHAWSVCNLIQEITTSESRIPLWKAFQNVRASDEMYIPTVLALLGCIITDNTDDDSQKRRIHNRRMTYCDWSMSAKNPHTFTIRRKDDFAEIKAVIDEAQKEGCLFARKFYMEQQDEITGDEWMKLIVSNKL